MVNGHSSQFGQWVMVGAAGWLTYVKTKAMTIDQQPNQQPLTTNYKPITGNGHDGWFGLKSLVIGNMRIMANKITSYKDLDVYSVLTRLLFW